MNLALGRRLLAGAIMALCLLPAHGALATINIPSNGDDGALNITSSTVIDLSDPNVVTTAAWDAATPGIAAYDSTKWAVVFHYTDVNIAAGATLSFINHPKNPPVVWLVSGSVTINGTVDIKGKNGLVSSDETRPGPGGFRGGGSSSGGAAGDGFGPGGSSSGGSYAFAVGTGTAYGNPEVIPLIGGSGGRGASNAGGGGGGAILIAAANLVTVNGTIDASGGGGGSGIGNVGGGGSGGAIRIVSDSLSGSTAGRLKSLGGYASSSGSAGRISANCNSTAGFLGTSDPGFAAPIPTSPPQIWPDAAGPIARIVEVSGVAVGDDPGASLSYPRQDVLLSTTGAVAVRIETQNIPSNSTVTVFVVKSRGGHVSPPVVATFESGSTALAYWTATIPAASLSNGSYAIQARAVLPQ